MYPKKKKHPQHQSATATGSTYWWDVPHRGPGDNRNFLQIRPTILQFGLSLSNTRNSWGLEKWGKSNYKLPKMPKIYRNLNTHIIKYPCEISKVLDKSCKRSTNVRLSVMLFWNHMVNGLWTDPCKQPTIATIWPLICSNCTSPLKCHIVSV